VTEATVALHHRNLHNPSSGGGMWAPRPLSPLQCQMCTGTVGLRRVHWTLQAQRGFLAVRLQSASSCGCKGTHTHTHTLPPCRIYCCKFNYVHYVAPLLSTAAISNWVCFTTVHCGETLLGWVGYMLGFAMRF